MKLQERIEKWICILYESDANPVGEWCRKREQEIDSNPCAISTRLYSLIVADEYLMDAAMDDDWDTLSIVIGGDR